MSQCRFFTDEDLHAAIAPALRQLGFDAVSTPEAGRLGESDEDQLIWSASEGRAIVTFNIGHFVALHTQWIHQGNRHTGIIVDLQTDVGEVVHRLTRLAAALDADAMQDRLEFLRNW